MHPSYSRTFLHEKEKFRQSICPTILTRVMWPNAVETISIHDVPILYQRRVEFFHAYVLKKRKLWVVYVVDKYEDENVREGFHPDKPLFQSYHCYIISEKG